MWTATENFPLPLATWCCESGTASLTPRLDSRHKYCPTTNHYVLCRIFNGVTQVIVHILPR